MSMEFSYSSPATLTFVLQDRPLGSLNTVEIKHHNIPESNTAIFYFITFSHREMEKSFQIKNAKTGFKMF